MLDNVRAISKGISRSDDNRYSSRSRNVFKINIEIHSMYKISHHILIPFVHVCMYSGDGSSHHSSVSFTPTLTGAHEIPDLSWDSLTSIPSMRVDCADVCLFRILPEWYFADLLSSMDNETPISGKVRRDPVILQRLRVHQGSTNPCLGAQRHNKGPASCCSDDI